MGPRSANPDHNLRANAPHAPHKARKAFRRRGLVLGEVLVLVALLSVVAAVLMVILGDARRNAQMGQCQTNLRSYASSTANYASDYGDLMWGFNWLPDQPNPSGWISSDPIETHRFQAVWIMNERGPLTLNPPDSWVPHAFYSHLVIEDYTASALPAPRTVCPSDVNRFAWNRDPIGFERGDYQPSPVAAPNGIPNAIEKRWPFSSTYFLGAAFWDISTTVETRVRFGGNQDTFVVAAGSNLGQPSLASVMHPGQKVLLSESHGFHHGTREPFHEYSEARINVLMVDGSVANRSAGDANRGWDPRNPTAPSSDAVYSYEWELRSFNQWYPRPLNGTFVDLIDARFRWTRDGLKGRDFDGPEARTGQP